MILDWSYIVSIIMLIIFLYMYLVYRGLVPFAKYKFKDPEKKKNFGRFLVLSIFFLILWFLDETLRR